MIKFFRKIRQNLLHEGKTGKYFKYAIGEIILVVIGIFIALQLNNWSEKQKTENKIVSILKEVQKDLGEDIIKSKALFAYYKSRDSIIQLAIDNKLTREDYLGTNNITYLYVAMNAFHLKIHSNGYKNLTDHLDDIPEKFTEIIAPLNEIYTYNKYEIDKFDLRLDKITDRLIDHLAATKPWYYGMNRNQISEEAIHYFLNDSLYKNALYLYSNASQNLTANVLAFNQNAINTYQKIAELTGYPEELPDFIPHHLIDVTPQQFEALTGNYKLIKIKYSNGDIITLEDPFIMKVNNHILEFSDINYDYTVNFYFKDNNNLYGNHSEATIIKNESKNISGLLVKLLDIDYEFIKVDY
ncbi:DUF6090 family protein [Lacinutrix iliipiscaria]|uniref:DUF6090 family protein n=1 Tax=Lacinutrix iliipiscaria TaxID=1230532 RepID=A0ABW5WK00_9FLAO